MCRSPEGDRIIQPDLRRSGSPPRTHSEKSNSHIPDGDFDFLTTGKVFSHKFPSLWGNQPLESVLIQQCAEGMARPAHGSSTFGHVSFNSGERGLRQKKNCHRLTWKSRFSSRSLDERGGQLIFYAQGLSVISLLPRGVRGRLWKFGRSVGRCCPPAHTHGHM